MQIRLLATRALAAGMIAAVIGCDSSSNSKPADPKTTTTAPQSAAKPTRIEWVKDLDTAKTLAKQSGKLIMIDVFTTWCGPCKMLDQRTFPDPRVIAAAGRVVPLKSNGELEGRSLVSNYSIRGYPAILFVDANGKLHGMVMGYQPPDVLAPQITKFADDFARSRS
ncbi:MAG: thioredoxin family protein [Phycisphaerae bacterium]|nr:thioredoxin family protein [Phycisphaerae bacterium]